MRFKRTILLCLVFASIFSCEKDKKNIKEFVREINTKEWNNKTLSFIEENCGVEKIKYDSTAPKIFNYKDNKTLTLKKHLEKKINSRYKLIDSLIVNDFLVDYKMSIEKITIIESIENLKNSWENKSHYEIYINDNKLYYVEYDYMNDKYLFNKKKWESPKEYVLVENQKCINTLLNKDILGLLKIKTEFIKLKEGKTSINIDWAFLEKSP